MEAQEVVLKARNTQCLTRKPVVAEQTSVPDSGPIHISESLIALTEQLARADFASTNSYFMGIGEALELLAASDPPMLFNRTQGHRNQWT
jgi:hypothetical protein